MTPIANYGRYDPLVILESVSVKPLKIGITLLILNILGRPDMLSLDHAPIGAQ